MLAKWWKKIGLLIVIIACLFNVTSKIVSRLSFDENVKSTITEKVDNVVTTVKNELDIEEEEDQNIDVTEKN